MTRSFDVPVQLNPVVRLRVGQHSPTVTRVVLELKEPMASLPIEEREPGSFILPLFKGTRAEAAAYLRRVAAQEDIGERSCCLCRREFCLGSPLPLTPGMAAQILVL